MDRISSELRSYLSTDKANTNYINVVKNLNKVEILSLLPYNLKLKKNATVMLLRNIQFTAGLANGTRIKVLYMGQKFIKVMVLGK